MKTGTMLSAIMPTNLHWNFNLSKKTTCPLLILFVFISSCCDETACTNYSRFYIKTLGYTPQELEQDTVIIKKYSVGQGRVNPIEEIKLALNVAETFTMADTLLYRIEYILLPGYEWQVIFKKIKAGFTLSDLKYEVFTSKNCVLQPFNWDARDECLNPLVLASVNGVHHQFTALFLPGLLIEK